MPVVQGEFDIVTVLIIESFIVHIYFKVSRITEKHIYIYFEFINYIHTYITIYVNCALYVINLKQTIVIKTKKKTCYVQVFQ